MWPTISNINPNIAATINNYANNNLEASKLNAWVRVYSGANSGLILQSNTDFKIFSAAGEGNSIYGNSDRSGAIGKDWEGRTVVSGVGRVLRPSPIITSLNSKEGQDQISRTCEFSITCFSLEQLELIQTYFMEPGYSVGVEWGWNTENSAKGLVNTNSGTSGILNAIANSTLNHGALSSKRFFTRGEYDIFLGFIVGSSVSNDGENFKVDVKLRGAPSLPTYLQSHNRITVASAGTEPDPDKSKQLYNDSELSAEGNTDDVVASRRFKAMFNELPSFRQTESVKSLLTTANKNDYINFDIVVAKQISEFQNKNEGGFFGLFGDPIVEVKVDGNSPVEVSKEKLFSPNKYIRFGLAIDILNKMGEVDHYKMGDKKISFKINIDNTIIGAFPYMFSTKASKLIIPGFVPSFTEAYFLNPADIAQYGDGKLAIAGNLSQPRNFDPKRPKSFVNFVEDTKDLNEFGLKEKKGYYGYLKNLFVNFDLFKSKIEQSNKNIREILLDILNEMSSAVNSFWNFQIVEGELKKNNEQLKSELRQIAPFVAAPAGNAGGSANVGGGFNPLGGGYIPGGGFTNNTGFGASAGSGTSRNFSWKPQSATTDFKTATAQSSTSNWIDEKQAGGDIVITVVDENWIGENPDPNNVKIFKHTGIGSPFLNSSLDISIPAEMANKIINKRLENNSQKDLANIKVGPNTLFNSTTDLFLQKVQVDTQPTGSENNQTEEENPDDVEYKKLTDKVEIKIDPSKTETQNLAGGAIQTVYKDVNGNFIKTVRKNENGAPQVFYNGKNIGLTDAETSKLAELESSRATAAADAIANRITSNIDKLDVVPIPILNTLGTEALSAGQIRDQVIKKFFSFTFDDTDFFDKMKNHYFDSKSGSTLSHPLPIKYSFTILGNSGIRRGDTFNIDGIPAKYRNSGIFQVTEIEHSLSNMRWETTVTGQYRQIQ